MENWIKPWVGCNYEVSESGHIRRELGEVRNNINGGIRKVGGKILSPGSNGRGYRYVSLYLKPLFAKNYYVHRLVAMAFIGEIPEGYEVNHKDGNKSNNHYLNLEIVTSSQNILHAYRTGLAKPIIGFKGSEHPNSKMTDEQVLKIRELHRNGTTPTKISLEFKTPFSTICKVCYRQTWKHI